MTAFVVLLIYDPHSFYVKKIFITISTTYAGSAPRETRTLKHKALVSKTNVSTNSTIGAYINHLNGLG